MEKKSNPAKASLTEGRVSQTLIRLAIPMTIGIFSVFFFNLADVFFVSKLGEDSIAAMGFLIPYTLLLTNINLGLGTGATSIISRLIAQENQEACLKKTVAGAYFFSLFLSFVYMAIGLVFYKDIFTLWGASQTTLSRLSQYLVPWLWGSFLLTLLMLTSAILRATGDTKTPSMIMLISGIANALLTPLLTFGLWGFPRMEMQGAALSTVFSWAIASVMALYLLRKKGGVLSLNAFTSLRCIKEITPILKVGLPAAFSNCLVPFSSSILIWLLAKEGEVYVAAFGIANRIEPLAMVLVIAMTASLVPFIGQNLGAQKAGRIKKAMGFVYRFLFFFELIIALLLAIAAPFLAKLFTHSQDIYNGLLLYLYLVPLSFAFQSLALVTTSFFNATQRPLLASGIIAARLFLFQIPLAVVGRSLMGASGIFLGRSLSSLLSGLLAYGMYRLYCLKDPLLKEKAPVKKGEG